ncbi:hypothetical protein MARPU_14420 [Marichromatium purpuratum 984]|uniref:Uncharacterized protein n=1 Tax=Marichromatium purpuratum 984 TaxID=765910 RepID=W0E443_MARPU|nr:hypothetical protein MARPU_14420 [Marichromatium purpuratum 984]
MRRAQPELGHRVAETTERDQRQLRGAEMGVHQHAAASLGERGVEPVATGDLDHLRQRPPVQPVVVKDRQPVDIVVDQIGAAPGGDPRRVGGGIGAGEARAQLRAARAGERQVQASHGGEQPQVERDRRARAEPAQRIPDQQSQQVARRVLVHDHRAPPWRWR